MNSSAQPLNGPGFSNQVAEQAVHWLVEMQGGALSARQHQDWQHWLNAHPEHQRAWEHIQRVNQRLRGLSPALAHGTLEAPRGPGRRRVLKTLLVLGAGSVLGLGWQRQAVFTPLFADYRSSVGERQVHQLNDGSQLRLNTGTAVDVQFDAQRRRIRLLEGELQLTLAPDPRPLQLVTAQGAIEAQGQARLNVRQMAALTQVGLIAGEADIRPQHLRGYPLLLKAGQQMEFSRGHWAQPTALDPNRSAWVDGMLVAAHMPLGEFLQEVARYRRGQLNCDPAVAGLLLSGSYPLGDTDKILDLLEVALPVKARRLTRYWVKFEPRAAS